MLPQSLSRVCIDHADLEGIAFLVSSIPSGSYIHSVSSQGSLSPEEELDGDILFRVECSKLSYFLHNVWPWSLYLFPFAVRRSLFADG